MTPASGKEFLMGFSGDLDEPPCGSFTVLISSYS
jgi:hypothetical protein